MADLQYVHGAYTTTHGVPTGKAFLTIGQIIQLYWAPFRVFGPVLSEIKFFFTFYTLEQLKDFALYTKLIKTRLH